MRMEPENAIRATRLQLNLTQTEMGDELGVTISTIWRWEKNIVPTPLWALKAVARLQTEQSIAS